MFFNLLFVSHVIFYISHLGKQATSCSRYTHCYPRELEFLSNSGSGNSRFLEHIDLLACLIHLILQPLCYIIHPLRLLFHPCYNTQHHDLFKLKLDCSIRSLSDFCLIMTKILLCTEL